MRTGPCPGVGVDDGVQQAVYSTAKLHGLGWPLLFYRAAHPAQCIVVDEAFPMARLGDAAHGAETESGEKLGLAPG
jgi:hypothetical protein